VQNYEIESKIGKYKIWWDKIGTLSTKLSLVAASIEEVD